MNQYTNRHTIMILFTIVNSSVLTIAIRKFPLSLSPSMQYPRIAKVINVKVSRFKYAEISRESLHWISSRCKITDSPPRFQLYSRFLAICIGFQFASGPSSVINMLLRGLTLAEIMYAISRSNLISTELISDSNLISDFCDFQVLEINQLCRRLSGTLARTIILALTYQLDIR